MNLCNVQTQHDHRCDLKVLKRRVFHSSRREISGGSFQYVAKISASRKRGKQASAEERRAIPKRLGHISQELASRTGENASRY